METTVRCLPLKRAWFLAENGGSSGEMEADEYSIVAVRVFSVETRIIPIVIPFISGIVYSQTLFSIRPLVTFSACWSALLTREFAGAFSPHWVKILGYYEPPTSTSARTSSGFYLAISGNYSGLLAWFAY